MCRLLRNYSIENGTETTVDDILQHFNDDKENSQCTTVPSARRIGIEIKELFGDSVETKRKSKGNKKIRVYKNLCQKLFVPKDIARGVNCYGWLLQNQCENEDEFCFNRVETILVNESRYTLDLIVNLSQRTLVVIGVNGLKVNEYDFCIPKADINHGNIAFLLYFLSRLRLCVGFKEESREEKVIRKENDSILFKVPISSHYGQSCNHIISNKCKMFVCIEKSMTQGSCCQYCSLVKKRLQHRFVEYRNIKDTKNCLLGRKELADKISILEKEKRNAVKRVEYWKDKFTTDSIHMDNYDHDDLKVMFEKMDKCQVPDGFELLIAQQRKALTANGPSGRRWHPK